MTAYNINIETEIFKPAQLQFNNLIIQLSSDELLSSDFDSIEQLIKQQGFEVLRLLLQGYLNKRHEIEPDHQSVIGADEVERTHKRAGSTRQLSTLFGTVTVCRKGYSKAGASTLHPLDGALNLPPDRYSQGLRTLVAKAAVNESFDDVVQDIKQNTASKVPKRQAEQLVQKISEDFGAYYKQRSIEGPKQAEDLVVLTSDAKGIVVRHEDLRDATRKAAEKQSHKKQTRLSQGEKANRKRMAQVASVYHLNAEPRTAEEVMAPTQEAVQRPKPTNKRVWASIERNSQEVMDDLFDEALRRDPEQQQQWVALVDGQEAQMKHLKKSAETQQVSLAIMMDFIHVLEYLWKAAFALLGKDHTQIEEWVKNCATRLLHSETGKVAAIMRSAATKAKLTEKQRKPIDTCAEYILKNKPYLDYKTALEKGWPIATGVIEGACRHLIKDRMDITGAKWSVAGAEGVLKLRALKSSGDLDDYLKYHQRCEKKRVHDSKYADPEILLAA